MNRVVAMVGPTGVGKTAVALEFAKAMGAEIVGADSRQVYRHMDIGTAKPTLAQRRAVPHHLIDLADPDDTFSLSRYLELAREAVSEIHGRGNTVLLVGGTGQYVWALLEGWQTPDIPPDEALRSQLFEKANREGIDALAAELAAIDPVSANEIDSRNVRRVVRALEIHHVTGTPASQLRGKTAPLWDIQVVGLTLPREDLYQRLGLRLEGMIDAGWVDEVRGLLASGYPPGLPSFSSAGYQEIVDHVRGVTSLEDAVQLVRFAHHKVARRQYTWFRLADNRIRWFDASQTKAIGVFRDALVTTS